ncbi:hypothetical protein MFM001_06680 [Mycobacterium sp. MFM001]|uniref:hypothetical protein n=1 Tax=Mycobacterium sp. MFM001 TaxID=2049453 RepID=UPI000DA4A4D9|nr:hypothetical protein [Mycobacterium sp. MFM001]GBE64206.1 hypothetical protein MFM001_06680 [Mycobacterium sp. MFM001]
MSRREYYCSVDEYATQIRDWGIFSKEVRAHRGQLPLDPNVVFNFARVAAVWERLRWDMHTKSTTPGDRNRLDELTDQLQTLATQLGLGKVDPDGFLPGDPSVYLANNRVSGLDPWWMHCSYDPKGNEK